MEDNQYSLSPPTTYKKDWLLFKDAVFTDLGMSDCNDTITGECVAVDTATQCADVCINDPTKQCFVGYFIENEKNKFCVPLRTNLEKQTLYYERLRNKDVYPSLTDAHTTVFIKKNKSFPPNRANTVFYKDRFVIRNSSVKGSLKSDDDGNVIYNDGEFYLRFLPHGIVLRNNEENYIPVEYDKKIVINIPQTNLNLEQQQDGHLLEWRKSSNNIGTYENVFYIRKIPSLFHGNDDSPWSLNYVSYDDQFYFQTSLGSVLCLDAQNIPYLKYGNIDDMEKHIFSLVPDVNVYCLDRNECNTVSLKDTEMNGIESSYNGEKCYRQPNCWRWNSSPPIEETIIILVVTIIVLILFVTHAWKHLKR